jgi:hypothetical protein
MEEGRVARKINLEVFVEIDEGTEEEAAQEMSHGCTSFGPIAEAFGGFPAGQFLGVDVKNIETPTREQVEPYVEEAEEIRL